MVRLVCCAMHGCQGSAGQSRHYYRCFAALNGAAPPASPTSPRSFTYEEFNACQQRHQKKAAEGLAVRNEEVLRSIEDIIELVRWGQMGRVSWGAGGMRAMRVSPGMSDTRPGFGCWRA